MSMTIAFPPSIGISFLFMGITKDLHTITRSTVPLLSWCRDHVSCSSAREGAAAASRSQGPRTAHPVSATRGSAALRCTLQASARAIARAASWLHTRTSPAPRADSSFRRSTARPPHAHRGGIPRYRYRIRASCPWNSCDQGLCSPDRRSTDQRSSRRP